MHVSWCSSSIHRLEHISASTLPGPAFMTASSFCLDQITPCTIPCAMQRQQLGYLVLVGVAALPATACALLLGCVLLCIVPLLQTS